MLAVIAAQALFVTGRQAPPMLAGFVDLIHAHVRPVVEDRLLGPELASLAEAFSAAIYDDGPASERAVA
jgi:histidine ammonia-lyase